MARDLSGVSENAWLPVRGERFEANALGASGFCDRIVYGTILGDVTDMSAMFGAAYRQAARVKLDGQPASTWPVSSLRPTSQRRARRPVDRA